jgi:hypothetical protein
MRVAPWTGIVAVVCAAAAILTGCSAGGSSQPALATVTDAGSARVRTFTGLPGSLRNAVHSDRGASRMSPEAAKSNLLYVSDDASVVNVYAYPKGTLVGTLRGFSEPQGVCSDKFGNVWVVNTDTGNIVEYAHAGTTPIAILSDAGFYPASCSVDPTTGNLAVANIASVSQGNQGNVAIFTGARGTPAYYAPGNIVRDYFCGYDNRGNLYVDGQSGPSSGFGLAKLARGKTTFASITLDRSIEFPGGVQWDGKHVAVGDQVADVIYQLKIAGSTGTVIGTTALSGASDVIQFWKQGSNVIGPDYNSAYTGFWKYPAGGSPTKRLTEGVYKPIGATVSKSAAGS